MKIVTGIQMQALDRRTILEARVPSLILMERAGIGLADFIQSRFGPLRGKRVTVLCGKGNNGGDGFVAARRLRQYRADVTVLCLSAATQLSRDAAAMFRRWRRIAGPSATKTFRSPEQVESILGTSDVIVDALLGTGLSTAVTGVYGEAIQMINRAGKPVIAVDIPSGLAADTGAVLGQAVRATATVSFGLPKYGLYLGDGIDHAGSIHVVDIGIPAAFVNEIDSRTVLVTKEMVRKALPPRPASSQVSSQAQWGKQARQRSPQGRRFAWEPA
jgi:NAD(P)H-hydrate epimerase